MEHTPNEGLGVRRNVGLLLHLRNLVNYFIYFFQITFLTTEPKLR